MAQRGETLGRLAEAIGGRLTGDPDVRIVDVTHDSRQAGPGTLFVAIVGMSMDGHRFVADAVTAGTSAIVAEHPLDVNVPTIVVQGTRSHLATLADLVHGRPSSIVDVVGVTGTNGKTSVAYIVENILARAGRRPGLIGTIQTRFESDQIPTLRTTPEASDFQRLLATMRDRGADSVVCEVSSHALALGRVDRTRFAVAAFTNLGQDHLDFHRDMEDYYAAKRSLFVPERAGTAVINVDDAWGKRLRDEVVAAGGLPVVEVGERSSVGVRLVEAGRNGVRVDVMIAGERGEVDFPLPGRFMVSNASVAVGCGHALGLDPEAIREGIATAPQIPGRFEKVSTDEEFTVIVDYAHTPDGIAGTVASARELATGRVIALIGAGGDRDRGKRPAMGAAGSHADVLVVTSDNPRSEDPDAIIADVMTGVHDVETIVEPDRAAAIDIAVRAARPGDVVLILGKGHERGQEIGDRVVPFDDRTASRAVLREIGGER